jgi:hypothetical protein
VRKAKSQPLVTDLGRWFEAQVTRLPARGPLAGAIRYALNHWDGLVWFLADGRIEPDTNTVERAMRPVIRNPGNPGDTLGSTGRDRYGPRGINQPESV